MDGYEITNNIDEKSNKTIIPGERQKGWPKQLCSQPTL